ncbi:UDP-glycosyltransferase 74G1-like [Senna tora]|uniref:UDP-glycosyltransferase 74G1-like n=1 Tax=Senna tora TaxID=362788 RepID=A0A835CM19_9FABA|nr:UDP-glycosyltransferase 74G1-like [Senna tora]
MLQFSKLLQQKGIKVTFVTTRFFCKNLHNKQLPHSIPLETISDGYDNGGSKEAESPEVYKQRFRERFGIVGVSFLTQNVGVNSIYYHVNKGILKVPLLEKEEICLPGLPSLAPCEMPSFLYEYGDDLVSFDIVVGQFSNIENADWILCNTFYQLHKEAKGSIVFVSFGTLVSLNEEQIEEIALGLRDSDISYLWVVRDSEQSKLPKDFSNKSEKGMVVSWCHQMKVLSHEAIGCFVTHCGWNSTLEALSLGVPLIAFPQWSDQATNAKFIVDIWKNGVRASIDDEKRIVRGEALKKSIWEMMKSEEGREIKNNAIKWRTLALMAVHNEARFPATLHQRGHFCDDLRRYDSSASLRRHRLRVPADFLVDSGSVDFRLSLGVISEDVVGMKLLDEEG